MSTEPQDRDIEAATEKLADNPALIFICIESDTFWKDTLSSAYAQSEALRESFAKVHAESIDTLARKMAAERAQEEADEAAEDARFDAMFAQERAA